jgi:DNA-binding MarR family transcriptional regulator
MIGRLDPFTEVVYSSAMNNSAVLSRYLNVADRLYERIGTALAGVGLSYAKYEVLAHLRNAGEPVTLGTLAVGQKCARSNITQIVDRLEAEDLVRRVADPADRRSVLAELTAEGAMLAQQGAAQMDRISTEFAASLGADDMVVLDRVLAKLRRTD